MSYENIIKLKEYLDSVLNLYEDLGPEALNQIIDKDVFTLIKIIHIMIETCPNSAFERINKLL